MKITKEKVDIYESTEFESLSEEERTEIEKLEQEFNNLFFDARSRWEKVCKAIRTDAAEAVEENGDYVLHVAECNAWETWTENYASCDDREDYLRELFVRVPAGYPEHLLNKNDPAYFDMAYASIGGIVCESEYPAEAEAYYNFGLSRLGG